MLKRLAEVIDAADRMFFGGLLLILIGAELIHRGFGLVVVGLLLVLSVKPVSRWWR